MYFAEQGNSKKAASDLPLLTIPAGMTEVFLFQEIFTGSSQSPRLQVMTISRLCPTSELLLEVQSGSQAHRFSKGILENAP